MKLKTWLLLSYFIVMILPLAAAYVLFAWIQSYSDEQQVGELVETSNQLQMIQLILDDPVLYQPKADRKAVEKLASDTLFIVLYNADGLVVYTSNQALTSSHSVPSRANLYKDLYHLKQGSRSYTYKQPVFDGNELVGFFDLQLARDAWVTGVSDRSVQMIGVFAGIFILIYLIMIRFVNRKLNRRLRGLMNEMTAFASGQILEETATNQDEIGALKRHFYEMRKQINDARQVIEEEQTEKEYMIATISHDLKTPLTSIKAYAEALENEPNLTGSEQAEYRQVIIEKSDFIRQMLDDLLMYTVLQSATYEMDLIQVDGSEFFEMLVSDYGALCKEKEIELHTSTHVTETVKVNPKQMMRVTDNLMSNAIQHTNRGAAIWLTAISTHEETPDWLFSFVKEEMTFQFEENIYLIVQNQGKGITREKIKYLFDPLYQTDQARSKKEELGTGLGLSITKQIMEKHGGRVQLFAEESIGVCVVCTLPKKEMEA